MFRTKYRDKKIQNICKNSLLRISYKNVYINENMIDIIFKKINNKIDLILFVSFRRNWLNNIIYFLPRTSIIDTKNFKSKVDIILCDKNFKIIKLLKNVEKNSNINCTKNTFNIWICKIGFIDFYNIKINNYISFKPIYNN